MDKQTESLARQEFEKWVAGNAEWLDLTPDQESVYHDESTRFIFVVWSTAWLSSRESLVVALPKREAFECWPHEAYMIEWDEGKYIPYAETAESLRAIGIRIKGEGV